MSKQTDLINIPDAITVSGSNVGIGTNSATNKLSVESSTVNNNTAFIKNTSGTGVNYGLEIVAGTNATDHSLHVTSSTGTSLLRVNGAGNVGIGTSSPAYKIDVAQVGGDAIRVNGGADFTGIALTSSSGGANTYSMRTASNTLFFYDGNASTERLRIDSSGRVTTPNVPAFLAFKSNGSVTSSQIVQWNNIYHNNGGHYSAATGKFTAPVDGYYHFTVGAIVGGSPVDGTERNGELQLQKNGSHYTRGHWNMKDRWENVSYTQVMYLSANDEARVSFVNSTGDNQMYGSDLYSHFGGHLIG